MQFEQDLGRFNIAMPHRMSVRNYKRPTFCDHCGSMLYGFYKQGMSCETCKMTIHKRYFMQTPWCLDSDLQIPQQYRTDAALGELVVAFLFSSDKFQLLWLPLFCQIVNVNTVVLPRCHKNVAQNCGIKGKKMSVLLAQIGLSGDKMVAHLKSQVSAIWKYCIANLRIVSDRLGGRNTRFPWPLSLLIWSNHLDLVLLPPMKVFERWAQ